MAFGTDLSSIFQAKCAHAVRSGNTINEVILFRILHQSIMDAAARNGHDAFLHEIHQHHINFEELVGSDFYRVSDRGNCVACELADLLIIAFNRHEARLCFMQNKFDKDRPRRFRNFKADTRQLYVLKNRPPYWKGNKHHPGDIPNNILRTARYSSIANYGVFIRNGGNYDMEYYNAEAILPPRARGECGVVNLDSNFTQYSTIDTKNDQLNFTFTMAEFGQALAHMEIGEKYAHITALLNAVNINEVNEYFRNHIADVDVSDVRHVATRASVSAKCVLIVNFGNHPTGEKPSDF